MGCLSRPHRRPSWPMWRPDGRRPSIINDSSGSISSGACSVTIAIACASKCSRVWSTSRRMAPACCARVSRAAPAVRMDSLQGRQGGFGFTRGGHQPGRQPSVAADVCDEGTQPGVQRVGRRRGQHQVVGLAAEGVHSILKDRLKERFPGGEVPVQRGVANPGVACDVVQRGVCSAREEGRPRADQQPVVVASRVGSHDTAGVRTGCRIRHRQALS
jgi:hypothetical protein